MYSSTCKPSGEQPGLEFGSHNGKQIQCLLRTANNVARGPSLIVESYCISYEEIPNNLKIGHFPSMTVEFRIV